MPSTHPSAPRLVATGLFDVCSFAELEARISKFADEHTTAVGDAFEIFFEAYLATQPIMQADQMWLVKQVDLDIRRELNLPADAKGIDGVYRRRTGGLVPYQVKFRSGRGTLSFSEVAPFLAVTDRSQAARLIVTNANELADDIKVRDGVFSLRGIDFDDLTPDDFAAVANWLRARESPLAKKVPRDDQLEALARIAETLRTGPRATAVMPCGTGKTLVQLWATERLQPKTVLVLVPSLSLLQQTLAVWSHEHSWGDRFEFLAVCSDPTVANGDDAIVLAQQDVDFPVDTDPAIVRRFLSSNIDAVKVIFSTYQSVQVVAEGAKGLNVLDVGIFDEAHKTTGHSANTFAFALDDARLPIRKRLFFTATPRHIDIRHRDLEGDFRVASMDDPVVYGPRAYTQSFAEAVERGIICDYRVVVSVVDPEEVTAFALQHGITLVKGDQQATQWVATQIAVSKAIAKTDAQKVITFHSRVAQAQAFASATPRGIGQYLDGFFVDHVNGTQRVSDRKQVLAGFRLTQRRLVTNARCLTEGVDLPAVDMVAFTNPRKSRVDIVQAVGRAMRKPPEGTKARGYVVIPILLAPHETGDLAVACAETDWADLIDVLAALRDHDARLDEIIRAQQIAKGRGEVFNPRAFAERVQVIGQLVALEVLERNIGTVVLERLGVYWDLRYGELVAFKEHYGHCNVPARYTENEALGSWVSNQRSRYLRGTLPLDRIARLDLLGIVWDPWDALWEQRYLECCAFKERFGHCNIPRKYQEDPSLSSWLGTQRAQHGRGALPTSRVTRLEALGIVWDRRVALWEQRYAECCAFKERFGHCSVGSTDSEHSAIRRWLRRQRTGYSRGALPPDRITRLVALGIVWDPYDASWEERVQDLIAFRERFGHCTVVSTDSEHPVLARWLINQRQLYSLGALPTDRVARLDALGIVWDPRTALWEQRYLECCAFKERFGHCNVPAKYPSNRALGSWFHQQRQRKKRGNLSADRVARLEALGVVWEPSKRT